ncbi:MAG: hypothetical protein ACRCYQ_09030 [Nocardioides sp.]
MPPAIGEVDPFDLPEWLGLGHVIWVAEHDGRRFGGHLVAGRLTSPASGEEHPCALLATDDAYPTPVADDKTRLRAHQAWRHGQVLPVSYDGSLALAVPGCSLDADRALEALARLARAVGADPYDYSAQLNVGSATGPA